MRDHPGHGQGAQRPRPSTAPDRRLLLAAGLLLFLGVSALVLETVRAFGPHDPRRRVNPSGWLLGLPRVEALAADLERVDRRVPMEAMIVVESDRLSIRSVELFRMWCAYLLPRHRLVFRWQLPPSASRFYLLNYPAILQPPPGGEELLAPGVVSLHRVSQESEPAQ